MASSFSTARRCIFGAIAYGLARKAPTLWNGSVLVKDGEADAAIRHRPMLVGERMQVATIVVGLAPICAVGWLYEDVIDAEIALRGEDRRMYGRVPPATLWGHVLA